MSLKHYVRPDDPKKLDYLPAGNIILGDSDIQGRGVFALKPFKKGDIIERCPLIEMANRSKYQIDSQVYAYMYAQPLCPCDECERHGFVFHMALGYGMMYNHQDDPNALWKFNYTQLLGDVIAIKDIQVGQEIFVSYGNCYFNNDKVETGQTQVKLEK